jgi:hypothetical protein
VISESDFQFFEDYAVFRPSAELSIDDVIDLISQGISFTASRQVTRLMVDSTALTGFPSPTTWQRFQMGERWAAAARPGLRLAVVARPELIDPSRFGVTVARNRGLFGNVFSSVPEAIEWLLDPNPS